MEPDLKEIYRLVRDNNQMLHSMRRRAMWGGIFRFILYLAALLIPIYLYFVYLYPIVKQIDSALTTATGKQVQLEGQFGNWADTFERLREQFLGGASSTTSAR